MCFMRFDFAGADCFLLYLKGQANIKEVIAHPAYKTILSHADKYGNHITISDIERAVQGEMNGFYAMQNVYKNMDRIVMFMEIIKKHQRDWLDAIQHAIHRIFPQENLEAIVIYPIIGYDAGIGMDECICMNLNWWQKYFETPYEFLSCAVHETFHAIYERYHHIPNLDTVTNKESQLAFFNLMLQNEGFAVYSPLKLRETRGFQVKAQHQIFKDYLILESCSEIENLIDQYFAVVETITKQNLNLEQFINLVFGDQRITYRVGCELIRRIERVLGLGEVQKAAKMSGNQLMRQYGYLLNKRLKN